MSKPTLTVIEQEPVEKEIPVFTEEELLEKQMNDFFAGEMVEPVFEIEEDDEIVSFDAEKGIVIEEKIIVGEKLEVAATKESITEEVENQYLGLLKDEMIRVIIEEMIKELEEIETSLFDSLSKKSYLENALQDESNRLFYEKRRDLRSLSWKSNISKEDLPLWVKEEVEERMKRKWRELLSLV